MNEDSYLLISAKEKIAHAEFKDAYQLVQSHIEKTSSAFEYRLIEIRKRHADLTKDKLGGVISDIDFNLLNNKITRAFLSLIKDLEEEKNIERNLQFEPPMSLVDMEVSNFIGRQEEISQLKNYFNSTIQSGKPKFIFIKGDFGAGKSTLVKRFIEDIKNDREETFIITGLCSKEGGDSGFMPFVQILLNIYRSKYYRKDREKEILDAIKSIAPGWLELILPHIRALNVNKSIINEVEIAALYHAPQYLPESMFIQYTDLLNIALREGQYIVFVEDLHFSDETSLHLLFHLQRNYIQGKVLFICTHRPFEISDGLNDLEIQSFNRIVAEMLMDANRSKLIHLKEGIDAKDYAKAKYIENTISDKLLNHINKKSNGLPLFINQIFSLWEESGLLFRDSDGVWKVNDKTNVDMPERVTLILQERINLIERNSSHLKYILDRASVAGEEFCAQSVKHLIEESINDEKYFDEYLEKSLQKRFNLIYYLSSTGDAKILDYYKFVHKFFQEHLYNNLSDFTKRKFHQKLGEYFENEYVDKKPVSGLLANHFISAGNVHKGLEYAFAAAQFEASKYSWIECKKWCERALELLGKIKIDMNNMQMKFSLLEETASTCYKLGDLTEAYKYYKEAITYGLSVNADPVKIAYMYAMLAEICDEETDYLQGLEYIDLGKRTLQKSETDPESKIAMLLLKTTENVINLRINPNKNIISNFEEILEKLPSAKGSFNLSKVKSRAINGLGIAYSLKKDFNTSIKYHRDAYEIAIEVGNYVDALTYLGNQADSTLETGDLETAKSLASEVILKSRELNDKNNESWGRLILGEAQFKETRFDDAIENLKEAVSLMEISNALYLLPYACAVLSRAYLGKGNIKLARETINKTHDFKIEEKWIHTYVIETRRIIESMELG